MSDTTPTDEEQPATVGTDTVEHVIRTKLTEALGGRPRDDGVLSAGIENRHGIVESAVPTIAFTVGYVLSHDLRRSLTIAIGTVALTLLIATPCVRAAPRATVR